MAIIYAAVNGYLDDIELERVRAFEAGFLQYLRTEAADVLAGIRETQALDDEIVEKLNAAIDAFKGRFTNADA